MSRAFSMHHFSREYFLVRFPLSFMLPVNFCPVASRQNALKSGLDTFAADIIVVWIYIDDERCRMEVEAPYP